MKKVLAIMGSPRKNGNTHNLILKILEATQNQGIKTEILFLGDKIIKECDGCHSCWKGNECSKNDDMNLFYSKIMESDFLIFGTPVYWFGPTALMKAFIDRLVYFNCPENRIKIRGKKAILVVPFEENHLKTADLLIKMFKKSMKYLEIPLIAKIIVPGVTKKGEVIKNEQVMKKCYDLGRKLSV